MPVNFGSFTDDSITGSSFSDLIITFRGDDYVIAGDGDDLVLAGAGNDTVFSGSGDDIVFGGSGNDTIYGEGGSDWLFGGSGNDELFGGDQGDRLDGNGGDDVLVGGDADDLIVGGAGFDESRVTGSILDYDIQIWGALTRMRRLDDLGALLETDYLVGVEALHFEGDDYTLFLNGQNNAVFAQDDELSTDEDSVIVVEFSDLIANDIDFDGDPITLLSINSSTTLGQITVNGNGTFSYDPTGAFETLGAGDSAQDSFTYTVDDGNGGIATATVTIIIDGLNDAPVAQPVSIVGDEDTVISGSLAAFDIDGDTLNFALGTGPSNGSVIVNVDGTFNYTPDSDFNGSDSFVFTASDGTFNASETVTITVNAVNDAPEVATVLAAILSEEGAAFSMNLLSGASDPDTSDILSVANLMLLSGDASGVAVVGDKLDVDPSAYNHLAVGESEVIAYGYDITDGNGGSVAQTATVTITGENDAPTLSVGEGFALTDLGPGNDVARDVAVQADGKILAVGYSTNGTNDDVALVRYNADGSLDTTYGNGGIVTTPVGSGLDYGLGVTLQADGKAVVAGVTFNGSNHDIAVLRYNTDGSLDATFGVGGIVTTPAGPAADFGYDVTLDCDGKILVAGYSNNGANDDFALVRYNADGSLDTTFGGGGIVTTTNGTMTDIGRSVTTQADGKILVAGLSGGPSFDFALMRYETDGSLDTTFGSGGIVTTPVGGANDEGESVTVQADGKILVAGRTSNGANDDMALVRYNTDGSLDTTFGSGGIVTTPIGSSYDVSFSVVLQPNGKIVLAGYSDTGPNEDFALTRYNADGSLDTTFGDGGIVTTAFGATGSDIGWSAALQADGKIVVVGYSDTNSNRDFAVARYNADGSLDMTFGDGVGDGALVASATEDDVGFILDLLSGASDPDTSDILSVANLMLLSGDASGVAVVGDTLDVDPSAYNHLAVGESEVIAYGYDITDGNGGSVAQTATVTITGENDAPTLSVGEGFALTDLGPGNDVARDVAVQADGKILAVGYSTNGTNDDVALVRYNADGSLDTTYGNGGIVTTPVGSGLDYGLGVTLQADGKAVVAGVTFNGSNHDIAVLRYNTDGSLDATFGVGGIVTTLAGPAADFGYDVTPGLRRQDPGCRVQQQWRE